MWIDRAPIKEKMNELKTFNTLPASSMPRLHHRYREALEAAPSDATYASKLIIFSPRFRGYYRFDGETFRDCVNAYLALKEAEFDRLGTIPDFQEVITGTTWHKIMFDLDYDIEHDKNVPISHDKYLETIQWFRSIIDEVIMASIDTYFAMFESVITRNDCLVYESMDEREPHRLSAHIIIQRMVPNFRIAAHFADLVIIAIPEDMRDVIDRGIYTSLRNLRIVGNAKLNSLRVKMLPPGGNATAVLDSFVGASCTHIPERMAESWMQQLVMLPGAGAGTRARAAAAVVAAEVELSTQLVERARDIIRSKYGDAHRFHRCIGSLVTFTRIMPSFCSICGREHEHDNSVMIRIIPSPGMTQFFELCRRDATGQKVLLDCTTVSLEIDRIISNPSRGKQDVMEAAPFKLADSPEDTSFAPQTLCYSEPAMRNYPGEPKTLFIRAPMKLGKTKALRKFVTDYVSHDQARIIFISFRRTFSASISKQFPEFVLYSDIKGSLDANKMIIQVESLHRIAPDRIGPVDLLILDESESIIDQFDSKLSADRNGDFAVFQWLVRTATRCIALDAYMSERTYAVISHIRACTDTNALLIKNTYKNARDDKYYITSSREQWLLALFECFHRGEKIVICANSATEGKTLYELLQNHARAETNHAPCIKFYCAETSAKVKARDFSDVAASWATCDILIYTPTLTAGVSFELHQFDRMFGYFTDKSCSAQTCIQMMGRIRNLKHRQIFICLKVEPGAMPETRKEMILWLRLKKKAILSEDLLIEYDEDGLPTIPDTDYAELRVQNAIARNRSRNNFTRELISMITETGARCAQLTAPMHQELFGTCPTIEDLQRVHDEHAEVGSAISDRLATAIANAREITGDEYKRICDIIGAQGGSGFEEIREDDRMAARKFELRATYRKHDAGPLTPDFVTTFMKPDIMEAFKNLFILCDYFAQNNRNMISALTTMRHVEAAHMTSIIRAKSANDGAGASAAGTSAGAACAQVSESESREFDFAYVYETHRLIHLGVTYLGFTSVLDTNLYSAREMELQFGRILPQIQRLIPQLSYQFKVAQPRGGITLSAYVELLNRIIQQTYGITLVRAGNLYRLALISLFHIRPDGSLAIS